MLSSRRRGEMKRDEEEERKEEKEEETRDEMTTRIGERRSRRCKMRKGETRRGGGDWLSSSLFCFLFL